MARDSHVAGPDKLPSTTYPGVSHNKLLNPGQAFLSVKQGVRYDGPESLPA